MNEELGERRRRFKEVIYVVYHFLLFSEMERM